MIYLYIIIALIFCFLLTLLVINEENKKEIRIYSMQELKNFEKVSNKIQEWSQGNYDHIIRTSHNT